MYGLFQEAANKENKGNDAEYKVLPSGPSDGASNNNKELLDPEVEEIIH